MFSRSSCWSSPTASSRSETSTAISGASRRRRRTRARGRDTAPRSLRARPQRRHRVLVEPLDDPRNGAKSGRSPPRARAHARCRRVPPLDLHVEGVARAARSARLRPPGMGLDPARLEGREHLARAPIPSASASARACRPAGTTRASSAAARSRSGAKMTPKAEPTPSKARVLERERLRVAASTNSTASSSFGRVARACSSPSSAMSTPTTSAPRAPERQTAAAGADVEPALAGLRVEQAASTSCERVALVHAAPTATSTTALLNPLLRQRRELVAHPPELREEHVVDQPAEHLDGRALRADDGVADHARDDLVVPDPPEVDPLVPFDQRLGELVERLVLAPAYVHVRKRQPGLLPQRVEGHSERRRHAPNLAPARASRSRCRGRAPCGSPGTPTGTSARACRAASSRTGDRAHCGAAGATRRRSRPRRGARSPPRRRSTRA